jgi:indole-3-glycerol phosphate synthase
MALPRTAPEQDIRIGPEVQGFLRWTPPGGTLGTICRESEARATALKPQASALERAARAELPAPSLRAALRGESVRVIAEVKRRSPSKGAIAPTLDAAGQARSYGAGGAAAISVLTEPAHFGGEPDDLRRVRRAVALPILRKDFHVRPIQLVEARALGASGALLIARALAPDLLREMLATAHAMDLEVLVEIQDEAELELALAEGASLIGVNNRNLETLVIDPRNAERLIPRIPADVVAVAESGISTAEDVARYAACGADAVLVGSSISAAADPIAATHGLTAVRRIPRGG